MKRFLFICMLLCTISFSKLKADSISLSSTAEISMLTCSPGKEIYSLLGHSAIRVTDTAQKIDVVFNYGTFVFDDKFTWNFIKGYLNYLLSVEQYTDFLYEYTMTQRSVYEQKLNLTTDQQNKFFKILYTNALPENRFYRYDYFTNNCASKIVDVFTKTFKDSISILYPPDYHSKTYRELITPYFIHYPWINLGLYIGLGSPADKYVEAQNYSFLPDKCFEIYSVMKIKNNGKLENIVKENSKIIDIKIENPSINLPFTPEAIFWFLFVIIVAITLFNWGKNRVFIWIDKIYFALYGLLGCLLLSLWLFTDHHATANNYNLIWAFPFHIIAIFLMRKKDMRFYKRYLLLNAIAMIILLIFWNSLPQQMHSALMPLVLIPVIRAIRVWFGKIESTMY